MSQFNLNIGDKVKIVGNESDHHFEIGQIVFFDRYEDEHSVILYDDLDDGDYWYVEFCDFEVL